MGPFSHAYDEEIVTSRVYQPERFARDELERSISLKGRLIAVQSVYEDH